MNLFSTFLQFETKLNVTLGYKSIMHDKNKKTRLDFSGSGSQLTTSDNMFKVNNISKDQAIGAINSNRWSFRNSVIKIHLSYFLITPCTNEIGSI